MARSDPSRQEKEYEAGLKAQQSLDRRKQQVGRMAKQAAAPIARGADQVIQGGGRAVGAGIGAAVGSIIPGAGTAAGASMGGTIGSIGSKPIGFGARKGIEQGANQLAKTAVDTASVDLKSKINKGKAAAELAQRQQSRSSLEKKLLKLIDPKEIAKKFAKQFALGLAAISGILVVLFFPLLIILFVVLVTLTALGMIGGSGDSAPRAGSVGASIAEHDLGPASSLDSL